MYRTALRSASRPVAATLRSSAARAAPRRFASTTPADKPRTWKGAALRWGLAGGALYYYFNSPVFADQATSQTTPAPAAFSNADLPTVDSVLEEKRKLAPVAKSKPAAEEKKPVEEQPQTEAPQTTAAETQGPDADADAPAAGSPAALEAEAGQQGAFNPETGEINWDCPCLGGMADGPCGEDFKTAFSCFVYSTEEPKGMDCIDKFQDMQTCFKKYPEIYGAELADDDEDGGEPTPDFGDAAPVEKTSSPETAQEPPAAAAAATTKEAEPATSAPSAPKPAPATHVTPSEDKVKPAETRQFDATTANDAVVDAEKKETPQNA